MTNDGDNQGGFSLSINGQFYGGQREMHIIISENYGSVKKFGSNYHVCIIIKCSRLCCMAPLKGRSSSSCLFCGDSPPIKFQLMGSASR